MPPGRSSAGEGWGKLEQRTKQQVGEEQVGLGVAQRRMGKPLCLHHEDTRANAVPRGIFGGDGDGDRIHVARNHRSAKSLGGGDGEDAGAGADIEHLGRAPALEQAIERDEAAARGGVMGGAEGKAGVDLKREAPRGHLAPVVTAMHQEAAGAHRPPQAFRLRHPILGGKRLDPERGKVLFAGNAVDQLDQPLAGGLIGVMRRHLDLGRDRTRTD